MSQHSHAANRGTRAGAGAAARDGSGTRRRSPGPESAGDYDPAISTPTTRGYRDLVPGARAGRRTSPAFRTRIPELARADPAPLGALRGRRQPCRHLQPGERRGPAPPHLARRAVGPRRDRVRAGQPQLLDQRAHPLLGVPGSHTSAPADALRARRGRLRVRHLAPVDDARHDGRGRVRASRSSATRRSSTARWRGATSGSASCPSRPRPSPTTRRGRAWATPAAR